jgi:hypothetical protein
MRFHHTGAVTELGDRREYARDDVKKRKRVLENDNIPSHIGRNIIITRVKDGKTTDTGDTGYYDTRIGKHVCQPLVV